MLQFFNDLSKKKEIFTPIKKRGVGLYTCGPTVYNYVHIGNLRTFLLNDILRRTLEYNGYSVKNIINITDVGHLTSDADTGEDKMDKMSKAEGRAPEEIAQFFTDAFLADIKDLNIIHPNVLCKATEHIPQQIKLIKKLEKNGFTYQTSEAVYFDTAKFPEYGKMAGFSEKKTQEAQARVEEDPEKKHLADFTLWFKRVGRHAHHIMHWDSPWGDGWPGWHIECSAMSMYYLGKTFDIHGGGIDLLPVHHINEIAQSEAATGQKFVNYWVHGEFILMDSKKMARSEGGFIMLQNLIEKGFNPLAFRYLCLNTHYRTQLNFSFQALEAAQNALNKLYQAINDFPKPRGRAPEFEERFLTAINDDLNMPSALAVVWDLLKTKNIKPSAKLNTLFKFDKVLGLKFEETYNNSQDTPEEIKLLAQDREEARQEKNWKRADEIRKKIQEAGYLVEDTPTGPDIKKIIL